jgi:probable F420-dependent oxidoreductase
MIRSRFRFGLLFTGATLQDWQETARKVEDLGFSTLLAQEHFGLQLAPLPPLVAAAAVTTRLRFGTVVLDNDFRHPAVLAKEAATLDVLTGGRFELGIGAGWLAADYEKTGIAFDAPPVRMQRLAETVAILKAFFTQESVSFHGDHYHVEALDAFPRPLQQPRPPLLIGGRQRRMLSYAAREAEIVSISMLDPRTPDGPPPPGFAAKAAWVRDAAGSRFDALELHANCFAAEVTDHPAEALERVAARLGATPEQALLNPANLFGPVGSIVEQLQGWQERCGLSYVSLQPRQMDAFAPVIARLS